MCEGPHGGEISEHLGPTVCVAYLWKRSNVGRLVFSAEDRGEGGGASTKTTFTLVLVRGPQKRSLAYQLCEAGRSSYPPQWQRRRRQKTRCQFCLC